MKIVLILVLLSFGGSEVVTAEFDYAPACDHAALRMFQGIDKAVEIRPIVPAEGAKMIEGTMIAYGDDGGEIGVYSCNPMSTADVGG